ncbi:LptF/LptG family permease [Candidatus Pelagibacter sp.]|jgi:lipopolysaccharide export system permease protein|nr:LptF/LptG family permease [Candidatus Pelagibacter sp.]
MKIYKKYILNSFVRLLLVVSSIFFLLALLLNLFEEINFFKDTNESLYYPLMLNFLNAPSILIDVFPFIFLISAQFLLINLIERNELVILKNFGIDNLRLVGIISIISFVASLIIIIFFYSFSAKLKHLYLEIKNEFASDNKYLAVITDNGIWIKDEIEGTKIIINADLIEGNLLKDVVITQFDNNFNPKKYIYGKIVNIKDNDWVIKKATIIENNIRTIQDNFLFRSNFNSEKINSLFSNLSSLTIWELFSLRDDYISVGYSIKEINLHLQKIYSFPIYLTILTVFASVVMLNVPLNKPKFFYLLMGIFASVLIFYINHFSSLLGENNKLPITLSVWLPHLIVSILTGIGMVRINEK